MSPGFGSRNITIVPVRQISGFVAIAFMAFFLFVPETVAYNPEYDDFSRLSCRPLSMGQAGTALADDPSAIFFNPAALANQHRFALMHNHSARHFPSDITPTEVDQLDGDTQAIIVPLGPNITLGIGFNFEGEMGYDYRPLTDQVEFPIEHFAGVERFEGLGFSLSPLTQIGAARRSFVHRLSQPDLDSFSETNGERQSNWTKYGDGYILGFRQRIFPGLTYAGSSSKVDFDYNNGNSGRITRGNSAWELKPAGWLTLVREEEYSRFRENRPTAINSDTSARKSMFGMELNLGGLARLRYGNLSGNETWGFEWTLPNLRLMYTEATNYLDRVLDAGIERMKNLHFYGFILYI
ncbi:hypothetical protein KAU08_08185 [bacterium]|nr:hypothetical protein [bacterium]